MDKCEIWYRFCQLCKYSYIRADDADTVYCRVPEGRCPHREEIEAAERKEE